MIVGPFTNGKLLLQVLKREKTMGRIERLVVFPVAALHLVVVVRRVRLNEFVVDAKLFQSVLEQGRFRLFAVCKAIGKLKAVVGLDALDGLEESFTPCRINSAEEYVLCSGKASR